LFRDEEGYVYYNNKKVSTGGRQGVRLLSVKTLQKNPDTREFFRLAGYEQAPDQELERKIHSVRNRQNLSKVK